MKPFLGFVALLLTPVCLAQISATVNVASGSTINNAYLKANCPSDTSVVCILNLPSGYVVSGFSSSAPAKRPNVTWNGSGMGTYYSLTTSTGDYILAVTGNGVGSVVECAIELASGANNWTFQNMSVDVGDMLVSSGACAEGNGINAFSSYKTTVSPPIQNLTINQVSVLGRSNTSPFHNVKCENVSGCFLSSSYALFAKHGFAAKYGNNYALSNLWSSGHSADCVILKSGETGFVNGPITNATVNGVTCTNAAIGDTDGVVVQAQNGNVINVSLSNLNLQGTNLGVQVSGDTSSIQVNVDNVNYVAAPYAGGGANAHNGLVIHGVVSDGTFGGFTSTGADGCVYMPNTGNTIGTLTLNNFACQNTFNNIFVFAGGGNILVNSPAIYHPPAASQPAIACSTTSGAATSCADAAGSGLWYVPGISFSGQGCSTKPSVIFKVGPTNAISGYTISNPGKGCPATINGVVTPNWNKIDFYNQDAGTTTTVNNPTFNGLTYETIGAPYGTDGIAPAIVVTTSSTPQ
jgi:hypothetical protein